MAIQHKKKKQDLLIDENSPFTYKEAYNELGVNVNYTMKAEGKKVLLVTSALPEEGKSTVSINLAIAMARAGQKVLLVECDLRAAAHPGCCPWIGLKQVWLKCSWERQMQGMR